LPENCESDKLRTLVDIRYVKKLVANFYACSRRDGQAEFARVVWLDTNPARCWATT